MLIGITGRKGSGKDTLAAMFVTLAESRGIPAAQITFAGPIKSFCAEVFGWSEDQINGDSRLREVPDQRYEMSPEAQSEHGQRFLSPRIALQQLGTEWGRAMNPDIWARLGVRRAEEMLESTHSLIVISDVRFPNEANAISAAGGYMIRKGGGAEGDGHASEAHVDSIEVDGMIPFCDTVEAVEIYVRIIGSRLFL